MRKPLLPAVTGQPERSRPAGVGSHVLLLRIVSKHATGVTFNWELYLLEYRTFIRHFRTSRRNSTGTVSKSTSADTITFRLASLHQFRPILKERQSGSDHLAKIFFRVCFCPQNVVALHFQKHAHLPRTPSNPYTAFKAHAGSAYFGTAQNSPLYFPKLMTL